MVGAHTHTPTYQRNRNKGKAIHCLFDCDLGKSGVLSGGRETKPRKNIPVVGKTVFILPRSRGVAKDKEALGQRACKGMTNGYMKLNAMFPSLGHMFPLMSPLQPCVRLLNYATISERLLLWTCLYAHGTQSLSLICFLGVVSFHLEERCKRSYLWGIPKKKKRK